MYKIFFVLIMVLLLSGNVLGWGKGHNKITAAALNSLPQWQQDLLKDSRHDLTKKYCLWVDQRKSAHAKPYMVFVGKRHFHYFPRSNVNTCRQIFFNGGKQYLEKIMEMLKNGKADEAYKYLGCFFHVIQDQGQVGTHGLEGADGLTFLQLASMIQPEDGSHPYYSRGAGHQILPRFAPDIHKTFTADISGYKPRLLGRNIPETLFHLSEAYIDLNRYSRGRIIPAILKLKKGDNVGAIAESSKGAQACSRLCADLIYTILCIHKNRFDPDQVAQLQKVDFTTIEPSLVPAFTSFPYRFTPLVFNCSLGRYRKEYPLEVFVEDNGKKSRKTFKKGFSSGMVPIKYNLPPKMFKYFEVTTGINATLGGENWGGKRLTREPKAAFTMGIKLNGKILWQSKVLTEGTPAEKVRIDISEGGELVLFCLDKSGAYINHANQPVWGNPVLLKK